MYLSCHQSSQSLRKAAYGFTNQLQSVCTAEFRLGRRCVAHQSRQLAPPHTLDLTLAWTQLCTRRRCIHSQHDCERRCALLGLAAMYILENVGCPDHRSAYPLRHTHTIFHMVLLILMTCCWRENASVNISLCATSLSHTSANASGGATS